MKSLKSLSIYFLGFLMVAFVSCQKNDTTTNTISNNTENSDDVPSVFDNFSPDVNIYVEGDYVILESQNLPDHKSPYYGTGHTNYEAYNGTNPDWHQNPNFIQEQSMVYRIPLNPTEASNKQNTNLGAIGISVNGVAIFNQYAGPNNQPLTNEINSFDQYNGHPQNTGVYHYHIEPLHLSNTKGRDALVGFLLDGFPVYGPVENGQEISNSDLDEYHGHFGPTPDYPEGIYHYHITSEDPYINGGQFFGTPGAVTN